METQNKGTFKFNVKDERKYLKILGTKIISLKDQLLLSSGVLSLDSLMGGGLQVGSILLIEEDEFGVFSKYLTKYFLAEGLACKHCLFVCSLDCDTRSLVLELPSPVDYSEASTPENVGSAEDLKIAWRYQDNPVVQSAPSSSGGAVFGHNFDLTCLYPKEAVDNAEVTHWPQIWPMNDDCEDPYTELLQDLQERIDKQGHSMEAAQPRRTVLRIAIHRLGSPLWPHADQKLPRFLYCLRKLVQSSYATAVVTLPTSLLQRVIVEQCEHLSDNVISLQSLANNPNPQFSEYSGLLNIVKLATLHTLPSHLPDTQDWAFKLRKKRFVIEKLHLPPELQDSAQREQDEGSGLSCASPRATAIDF